MTIAKTQILQSRYKQPAVVLLKSLGLNYYADPRRRTQRRDGFWLRHEHDLHGILQEAANRTKELIVRHHPDRSDGCEETCKRVSQTWQRLEKIFSQKGITLCD